MGYAVTREYYINDGGIQIDHLARSVHHRYLEALGEAPAEMPEGTYPGAYLIPVGQKIAEDDKDRWQYAAEADWMPACNATYKVNIQFDQWSPQSGIKNYSHPFTTQVDLHTSSAFMTNARTRRLGLKVNTQPQDFLLNGVLAAQGKGPITPENFPFAIEYGYHFDSKLLGEFLSKLGQTRGVNYQQQHIQSVIQQPNGSIAALVTEQGERIEADLFVDCTGFASVLMQKSLKAEFDSFSSNLFNNSAFCHACP